jgi:hypothetical protein
MLNLHFMSFTFSLYSFQPGHNGPQSCQLRNLPEQDVPEDEMDFHNIDWAELMDKPGKIAACLPFSLLEFRRQRKLMKHRGVEGDFINITYMCNFIKERPASRQAKQKAGHVAAVQAQQAVTDQANFNKSRVGKNALNTAVSSCGCMYQCQMQRFEALPGKLFISLTKGGAHSNNKRE